MKKLIITLNIYIMASITSFGQNELKNGVYEFFIITDTTGIFELNPEKPTIRRTLIVENDTVLYSINDYNGIPWAASGINGEYLLKLEKYSDNLYKGKNEYTELNIMIMNHNNIEVETLKGSITYYYSGGQYIKETINIPLEKQTLTFVRELTAEDKEKLLSAKRTMEYKNE